MLPWWLQLHYIQFSVLPYSAIIINVHFKCPKGLKVSHWILLQKISQLRSHFLEFIFIFYIQKLFIFFSRIVSDYISSNIFLPTAFREFFSSSNLFKTTQKIEEPFASLFTIKNLSSKSVKNVERRRNQSGRTKT